MTVHDTVGEQKIVFIEQIAPHSIADDAWKMRRQDRIILQDVNAFRAFSRFFERLAVRQEHADFAGLERALWEWRGFAVDGGKARVNILQPEGGELVFHIAAPFGTA